MAAPSLRRGSSLLEFTLAGVPILFTIISIIEVARGMWISETLAYAVKEASRLAVVHGENCSVPPNSCALTVSDIARRIADSSQGLYPDQIQVTLSSTADGATVTCGPLSSCLANGQVWPAYPGNTSGSDIVVTASYPFESPMAIFFPGFGGSASFVTTNLPASSRERIQF